MSRRTLPATFLAVLLLAPSWAHAQQLDYLGKSIAHWGSQLSDPNPVARRSAAFALGKIGSSASSMLDPLLRKMRDDKEASVREACAYAVGEVCKGNRGAVEGGAVIRALQQALKDGDPLVRRSAAVSLGDIGFEAAAAVPALQEALKDTSPAVRQNAAWALGQMKSEPSITALRRTLRDADSTVIREAAKALGHLGPAARSAKPELLLACDNSEPETRNAAVATLVGVVTKDDQDALGPLVQRLQDRDPDVKYNAALALGNIGGDGAAPAVPVLLDMLVKGDEKQRQQAAVAISGIGPAAVQALVPLRKALHDPDPALRMRAAVALGGLARTAAPAYQDLVQVLANTKEAEKVRLQAGTALMKIGGALYKAKQSDPIRQAVPTLISAVKNSSNPPEVRLRSLWALRALQNGLNDYPELFDTLDRLVAEPKTYDKRMLRYDAAFLLGVFKKAKVSKAALNVLSDFLKDSTVLIFVGPQKRTTSSGESGTGKSDVSDLGKGDGRRMAVQALLFIAEDNGGVQLIRSRPDIVQGVEALRNSPDEQLRKTVGELLEKLNSK
jgi:HEAT repeat protein